MYQLHANTIEFYKENTELLHLRKFQFMEQCEEEIKEQCGEVLSRENKLVLDELEKMFDTLLSFNRLPDEEDVQKLYKKLQVCSSK